MPEMDVVRFTESDVVVASIPRTVSFQNFADGKARNGSVTYNGVTYGWGTAPRQADIFHSHLYSTALHVINNSESNPDIQSLINYEAGTGLSADGVADGDYVWDGLTSTYVKQ